MSKRLLVPFAAIGLSALALLAWVMSGLVLESELRASQARAQATLQLTMQALDGHLRRFQAVPDLLADDGGLRALVVAPAANRDTDRINTWLAERNGLLDSSVIYVMAANGVTIASSNHDQPDSFIGQDFSFRPYFTDALASGRGRFFALGTTSGVRGYYFAAAVKGPDGRAAGVIAVKVDLDAIEADWRRQAEAIVVTDAEGVVFLSTEPEWLYQSFLALTPDRTRRTIAARRYADKPVGQLAYERSVVQDLPVLRMTHSDGGQRSYLEARALMPLADWSVHVLLDIAGARNQARLTSTALLLGLGIVAGLALNWWQRRQRLAAQIAAQESAKAELERRVAERTADLARVNGKMAVEVAERRAAEAELRRTQADLVQAGKLAALGQMSAALSHEINQPLAAARNFADSAAILIDRGDNERARQNVGLIIGLIDRMATIAQHLRNVARKPDAPMKVVDLAVAVTDALALAEPRLAGVTVTVAVPDNLLVLGGPVRLQQVLGNVISNAVDALEDRMDRRIEISAAKDGTAVLLHVRDYGPGVAPAIADRIFDPFFTTKRVGSGLGLGLSISYNIMKDFGGDLKVANHPQGGAVFTLALNAADARQVAAE